MIERDIVKAQLKNTFTELTLNGFGEKYSGKVRDSYIVGDKRIIFTSDRLSAFDRIISSIPFKGQVLNGMASYWFAKTEHIIPNHLLAEPHPNVLISKQVNMLPVEVIVRGYLTGSAWRDYEAGNEISGIKLPKGMKRSQRFETPLLTPSTKAEMGMHDEPISCDEVVSLGLVDEALWNEVKNKALELFNFGSEDAAKRNLILVDTKYEFGTVTNPDGSKTLILADEVHTQDSSRYWVLDSYNERYNNNLEPQMLDKEFVRGHLIERGFMGDGELPLLSDEFRIDTAMKYIEAYERLTGKTFIPATDMGNIQEKIETFFAK